MEYCPSAEIDERDASHDETTGLKHSLKDRHLSLIALAGIIGPGLAVGAGLALRSGPAALLLGFGVVGILAFCMMQSLGELVTMYPTGGTFSTLGAKLVDYAWGSAVGWNYVIIWVAVLANEYNSTAAILQFWGPQVPLYGYILMLWGFFTAFQFLGSGSGWHACFGFHYWNDPGAFASSNGFKSFVETVTFASTFYSGCEVTALAASESKNPQKAMPTAIRQTFWRILIVYIGAAIAYGMTVPYNDPALESDSKTLKSPMTIAIQRAGWEGGVHLVNAFIIVICVSAISSSIYTASRAIVNLAHEGAAPRFLRRVNKQGVPYPAVILASSLGLISMMNQSTGAADAYLYIVNLSGVAVFIVWGNIMFYHLRFRRALKLQGRSVDELPYKALWYPYLPIFGLILNTLLALIQGWSYFKPFDAGNWVDAYILLPFFGVLYFGFKFWNKTKWVDLREVDLDQGRREDVDKNHKATSKWLL
ncbi:General amino acid permease AGP3 [Candida viswanathii]|uniref:General amino acid permease AGP3 n=1 Tax=Candida viswanathii TaxID=5486 RepID=A0A367XR22_9ASCO|nr:General amino acid permease AGP3 [Candida viswanathii]